MGQTARGTLRGGEGENSGGGRVRVSRMHLRWLCRNNEGVGFCFGFLLPSLECARLGTRASNYASRSRDNAADGNEGQGAEGREQPDE